MRKEFRVMDCRETFTEPTEIRVLADTPEQAARLAIGEELIRGTRKPGPLRARVYVQGNSGLTLVRLYARTAE
jgi:hypothetical protein